MHLLAQYDLVPAEAREAGQQDATRRRELKVARFRREKEAQTRLDGLRLSEPNADDSEFQRSAWLARIELAALKSAEQRPLLAQVQSFVEGNSSLQQFQSLITGSCCKPEV